LLTWKVDSACRFIRIRLKVLREFNKMVDILRDYAVILDLVSAALAKFRNLKSNFRIA